MTHPLASSRLFWIAAIALTAARLAVLALSPLSLGPDEAQYWRWGQSFDWGYFSKPPLVGWLAGAASAIAGDTAFGARWPSPLLHVLAAVGVRACVRSLRPEGPAADVAGMLYLIAPGVALSANLVSTDALLMPATAWALAVAVRLRGASEGSRFGWAVALGALIGTAALAKYAAVYLLGALVLGMAMDRPLRRALLAIRGGPPMMAAFLAVLGPNLVWNAANGGATLRHTAANANWDDVAFDPMEPLSWLGEQFGVFGLLVFPLGLWVAARALASRDSPVRAWAFWALLPIGIVFVQAFVSKANANWAAIAMPALCVFAALALADGGRALRAAGWAAAAVQTALMLALGAITIRPALADQWGLSSAIADVRGWPETADAVLSEARRIGASGVVVDTRGLFHGIDFAGHGRIGPEGPMPLRIWRPLAEAQNTAEETATLEAGAAGRWLLVSLRSDYDRYFAKDFAIIAPAGTRLVALGTKRTRTLRLFVVEGYAPSTRSRLDTPPEVERAAVKGI